MNNIISARSALDSLDPSCVREEWVRIGMAAKSSGLSFNDFHDWSKNGVNYANENDCRNVWKSFDESGGITAATLFGMAKTKGWYDSDRTDDSRRNGNRGLYANKKSNPSNSGDEVKENKFARDVWDRCLPALSSHEYILKKCGKPDGLRYYPSSEPQLVIRGINVTNYLVVPCWSNEGLQTLQFIPPRGGDKLNLPRAAFNDAYFTVGIVTDLIYLVEGIGQAWAAYQAKGAAAVVCFGAGRMMTVAKALRVKYPKSKLVIVPDRGKESLAAKIADVLGYQWAELPNDKTSNYDANDYAQEYGYDALGELLSCLKSPQMRYKLLSGVDLFNLPPMRWMVQGVIPTTGLAALYGASGSGKSFLILDMGCAVAAGDKYWFGRRVSQAPVTYICLEGEAGLSNRVKAWSEYFGRSLPNDLRFITQSFDLLSDDVEELAKAVVAVGGAGGLVIIDTLNRAAPGADENSSVDMGKIIAAAMKLQNLTGGLVLLVHHTGKDASKGLRGHSSLYASLDGAIEVVKTDIRREWSVAKSKDDISGEVYPFKLEIVKVGLDTEGSDITSCVVMYDGSKGVIERKKRSLGANQSIALRVIIEQLRNSSHKDKDGAPAGRACVNYDEVILAVAERMTTDAKHRKSSALTAVTGLVNKGYLDMKNDWLWER